MNRFAYRISPALVALTLLGPGLSSTAQAQQPARDLVAFKATLTGFPNAIAIPREPPIVSIHLSLTGQSDLLGQVTLTEHHYARADVEGIFRAEGPGIAVLTAANGDALFIDWSGRPNPPTSAGIITGESSFFVTGGRGRFLGATGGGVIKFLLDPADQKTGLSWSVEGMVSRPKP
jgi:hypothetical protein